MRAHDPRASIAFADAVLRTLEWGGRWNFETLRAVWAAVPGEREVLRHAVYAKLVQLDPTRWSDDTILPWLLSAVVIEEPRAELWKRWSDASPAAVPWKQFLNAGLPPQSVVQWAVAVVSDRQLSEQCHPALVLHTAAKSAANALKELSTGLNVDVLIQLMQANVPEHSWAALNHLCTLSSAAARRLRLQLWLTIPPEQTAGSSLIFDLLPEAGEADLWRQVAQREEDTFVSVVRWALYALVAVEEDRWAELRAGLDGIEALLNRQAAEFRVNAMNLLADLASLTANPNRPHHIIAELLDACWQQGQRHGDDPLAVARWSVGS